MGANRRTFSHEHTHGRHGPTPSAGRRSQGGAARKARAARSMRGQRWIFGRVRHKFGQIRMSGESVSPTRRRLRDDCPVAPRRRPWRGVGQRRAASGSCYRGTRSQQERSPKGRSAIAGPMWGSQVAANPRAHISSAGPKRRGLSGEQLARRQGTARPLRPGLVVLCLRSETSKEHLPLRSTPTLGRGSACARDDDHRAGLSHLERRNLAFFEPQATPRHADRRRQVPRPPRAIYRRHRHAQATRDFLPAENPIGHDFLRFRMITWSLRHSPQA